MHIVHTERTSMRTRRRKTAREPWERSPLKNAPLLSRMFVETPTAEETRILNSCYHEARTMIDAHEWAFRAIERRLLEKRRIGRAEFEPLLGPRPWA